MDPMAIVGLQFAWNVVMWTLIVRWFIAPRLAKLPLHTALSLPMLINLVRPISLWMTAPPSQMGITVPESWAMSTAIGDLITAALALVTIVMLRNRAKGAIAMAWVVNVFGFGDALKNGIYGAKLQIVPHLGPGSLVVTYAVPVLFVAHGVVFWLLIRAHRRGEARA